MRNYISILLLLAALMPCEAEEYEHYSEWMAHSEMSRVKHSYNLDYQQKKWTYAIAIELEAMLDTYLAYGNEELLSYAREYPDYLVDSEGTVYKYKLSDYKLDDLRPAMLIFRLNQLHPTPKYQTAMAALYEQLATHPRTSDGIFWHKKTYHDQVWLDGLYMAHPFYASYAQANQFDTITVYNDIVDQLTKAAEHTYDPDTKLWRHGYDESRTLFWADKSTGQSAHCWGRALGWMSMAIIELLDILPEDFSRRQEVIDLLRLVMDSVIYYQDANSGVWRLVTDVGSDARNYLEATCSAMFTYSLLKGHRMSYLPDYCLEAGIRGYKGIISTFVSKDSQGRISLNNCCSVGGLGPETSPNRDGSFEYYISEQKRSNDGKGIAPFIWASLEMERLGYTTSSEYTSGIKATNLSSTSKSSYNLAGQKTAPSYKGLVIINDKKYLQK